MDYVLSLELDSPAAAADADGLREAVRALLASEGTIRIPKETGAFVAT